jgi:hypothetical protein
MRNLKSSFAEQLLCKAMNGHCTLSALLNGRCDSVLSEASTLTAGVCTTVKPDAASAAAFAWTASAGGSLKPGAARGEPAYGGERHRQG